MEDLQDELHTFGKEKYVAAVKIQRSYSLTIKNILILVTTVVKCTILGIFITIKSLLRINSPGSKKDIRNQVALVTGGANGLGRAICSELARCGCNVAVADADIQNANKFAEELMNSGVKAKAYEVDVSNYDEIVALKEKIKIDLGDVDILVNNAGLLPKISLLQGEPSDLKRIINVNLVAHFWTIRVFLPDMIARRSGHIVGISSIMGFESTCRAICYSATKFGIRGLMDGLHELSRLDKLNIKVTTVYPPLVNTRKSFIDLFSQFGGLNDASQLGFLTADEVAAATVEGILKNRKTVSVPCCMTKLITLLQFLPNKVQSLVRDHFKPKVGPLVYETTKIPTHAWTDAWYH